MALRTRAFLIAFCMNFAVLVSIQTLALAQSEATTLTGRLAMLWVDAFDNGQVVEAPPIVTLLDDAGVEHELSLAPALVAAQGGIAALQGRRVTVAVEPASAAQTDAAQQVHALLAVEPAAAPPVIGNERWAIVLCRAAESAVVVPNPLEHYTRLWSNTYPGVEHYWRELYYDQYSVAGVSVHGWYDLPQPGSAYWYQHTDGNYRLNTQTVREDCATAADGDVDFPGYAGIIFVVPMPTTIGFHWTALGGFGMLNRDGVNKMYRTAYLPREVGYSEEDYRSFMSQNVLVHEMGHGLGLPHSSGPYDKTYDSSWDVMSGFSAASAHCEWDVSYGCIAPHTIAYHKDLLGWFALDRKLIVAPTSPQMVTLARMAQPRSDAPFFVQIPLTTDGKRFYTVEYRSRRGYDRSAPYGVVIHEVDTMRPNRTAQVVDPDGNGDPTDSGASWVPGEVFRDAANNVHVCIEADAGSDVLVGIGGADLTCPFAPHFESNVAFGANTQYPTTGAVVDMYLEMTNGGAGVAPDVAVTITLSAQVAVITDTIDTMNGVVRSLDPFVFGVGDMVYDDYAHVIFQVQVDPALTASAQLESIVEITWTGGSLQKELIQIANPRFVYLPAIQR